MEGSQQKTRVPPLSEVILQDMLRFGEHGGQTETRVPPRSEVILQDMLRFRASLGSAIAVGTSILLQLPAPSATANRQSTP